jgi:phosphoenolpyruvate-protein phosphotransferase (PTS system enzyme I)
MKKLKTGSAPRILTGIALSPGLVVGTAYKIQSRVRGFHRISITAAEVDFELRRFRKALAKSTEQLHSVKSRFESLVGEENSHIFDAHLLILEDRRLLEEVEARIRLDLVAPERAVEEVSECWLSAYRALQDPFFRERGSDVEEVMERIIANLMELDPQGAQDVPEGLILVASEVSLALLADYRLERIKGLVLTRAGRTSHVTIIARSYRIPVVSNIENVEDLVRTGETVIVDGSLGVVHVGPEADEIRRCQRRISETQRESLRLSEDSAPCMTHDGRRIHVHVNTEIPGDIAAAVGMGAEGVGLFRSEFIYMQRRQALISEEDQFEIYRNLAQTLGERPVVIRTLDVGEGNPAYFVSELQGADISLGLRGIRLSLKYPEVFRAQLRAILRASAYGNLKIVLPMVSNLDEVIVTKRLLEQTRRELQEEGHPVRWPIELGVMVEVPSLLFTLEHVAAEADFLAVGTNDLIQYTLAVSRTDERVAFLFNPLHPAVLASLKRVAEVSAQVGKTSWICGEAASNPLCVYVLIGLGFQHLSMNPHAIPGIKRMIREVNFEEARQTVAHLLTLRTLEEIEVFVEGYLQNLEHYPRLVDHLTS